MRTLFFFYVRADSVFEIKYFLITINAGDGRRPANCLSHVQQSPYRSLWQRAEIT